MHDFWNDVLCVLLGIGLVIGMIIFFITFLPIMICVSIIIAAIGLIGCVFESLGN